jgi:hypothetical protein
VSVLRLTDTLHQGSLAGDNALDCGLGVWDYAESYALQAVIRDHGTPEQKQRLKE